MALSLHGIELRYFVEVARTGVAGITRGAAGMKA